MDLPQDLMIGIVGMLAVSFVALGVGIWISKRVSKRVVSLLAILTVLAIIAYIVHYWDAVLLAQWLPYSNLIIISNWFAPASFFLAGMVYPFISTKFARRYISVAMLVAAGVYSLFRPVLGEAPRCITEWDSFVCLQTSDATCSAAAAATLLNIHGIQTTEQEMAELCLTRRGTTWKGLYRGLKLKVEGTNLDVEVFDLTFEQLVEQQRWPSIIACGLDEGDAPEDLEFYDKNGWVPGLSHSVVLLDFQPDHGALVGDPSVGPEGWPPEVFETLWQGIGVRLVPKPGVIINNEPPAR